MKIKYEKLILDCFRKFDLTPRDNQLSLVNDIVMAYIDEKKEYVVLSAPTGTGKSIVAVIVAECIAKLTDVPSASSYILMSTNTLTKQYRESFSKYGNAFVTVKGANNYGCAVLQDTAEHCIYKELSGVNKLKCNACEFKELKERKYKASHFITNYSYYFISAMYNQQFQHRQIAVFDEAHLINDTFSNHMALKLTMSNLKFWKSRMNTFQTMGFDEFAPRIDKFSAALQTGRVTMSNYGTYIEAMKQLCEEIIEEYEAQASNYFAANNMTAYTSYAKIIKMFKSISNNIFEVQTQKNEYAIDIQDNGLIITPIFVGSMFKRLRTTDYSLFMSATIDASFISQTLRIPRSDIKFIKSPPVFKQESKSVTFLKHGSYNYKNLNNPAFVNSVGNIVADIVKEHSDTNGIILTSSFKLTEQVSNIIRKRKVGNLVEHERGNLLADSVYDHKTNGKPSVLISPSLFEGIDLPDDESRFQILTKAPYPSLGDKRIRYIFDNYPDIYEIITIYKIIQGLGRSTRNNKDYSMSYALDSNIARLFFSPKNKWKNEFKVV